MVVEIKNTDTPEEVDKKLQEMNEHIKQRRIKRFKPYFGILKTTTDPLAFQKK